MGDDGGGGVGNLITIVVIIGLCIFLGYYLCIIKNTPKPIANLFTKYLSWSGCGSSTPTPPDTPSPHPGPHPSPGPTPPAGYYPPGYTVFQGCAAGDGTNRSLNTNYAAPECVNKPGVALTAEQTKGCINACARKCNNSLGCNAFVYNTGRGSCFYDTFSKDQIPLLTYQNDSCCSNMLDTPSPGQGIPCYGVYGKTGTTFNPSENKGPSSKCGTDGGGCQ